MGMSRNTKINGLLLLLVAALAVLPIALGMGEGKEEPFTGADAQAETAITELKPDYEPWFSPLYEPPSGEVESALFALQAALGAGVLAYYFGVRKGRRQGAALAAAAGAPDTAGVLRTPPGRPTRPPRSRRRCCRSTWRRTAAGGGAGIRWRRPCWGSG